MANLEFKECDTCAAKPGSPPLCAGCLNNRQVIYAMGETIKRQAADLGLVKSLFQYLFRQ